MFDNLVRDGVILFLAGVTILTKVAPAIRLKNYADSAVASSLWIGWILTVAGFITLVAGVATNSW
jgi:hypothetical protein